MAIEQVPGRPLDPLPRDASVAGERAKAEARAAAGAAGDRVELSDWGRQAARRAAQFQAACAPRADRVAAARAQLHEPVRWTDDVLAAVVARVPRG